MGRVFTFFCIFALQISLPQACTAACDKQRAGATLMPTLPS